MQLADDLRMKNEQHVSYGGLSGSEPGSSGVNLREGAVSRVWLLLCPSHFAGLRHLSSATLEGRYYGFPHFTEEKTKA